MSYIGVQPGVGQYRKLDDISGSFNGSTTTFTTSVAGENVTAITPQQLIVSVGGVIQQPVTDYTTSTNSIIFSTAPGSGLDFFAVLMGDAVNVGTPSDGSVTTAKLGADLTVDLASGTAAAPSLTFDSNTGLFSPGADEVAISNGGTERARIDSSGRLLVGTSSTSANTTALFQGYGGVPTGGAHLRLAAGTNSPANGANLGLVLFSDSQHTNCAFVSADRDGGTWSASSKPTRLVFSTTADGASSPTERMRIAQNGKTQMFANANDNVLIMRSAEGAGTATYLFAGARSATGISDGTIVFGVFTNGNAVNTNGSYTTISDAKLKENIVTASSQWNDLKAIQIRNWNFKEETGYATHRQIGPIAQELEQVCPGLVFETPDRDSDGNDLGTVTKGVNQSVLYMKAVKALQEAMERIETLEAKVAALESA